jgi:hypothetical protein
MAQKNLYLCYVALQERGTDEVLVGVKAIIAESEGEALERTDEFVRQNAGTGNLIEKGRGVRVAPREDVEEIAIQVLGWSRPTD